MSFSLYSKDARFSLHVCWWHVPLLGLAGGVALTPQVTLSPYLLSSFHPLRAGASPKGPGQRAAQEVSAPEPAHSGCAGGQGA